MAWPTLNDAYTHARLERDTGIFPHSLPLPLPLSYPILLLNPFLNGTFLSWSLCVLGWSFGGSARGQAWLLVCVVYKHLFLLVMA